MTTASTKAGEITVFVDGKRVVKKHLRLIEPDDAEVLAGRGRRARLSRSAGFAVVEARLLSELGEDLGGRA